MSGGKHRSMALYLRRIADAKKTNTDAYNERQATNKDNVGQRASDFDVFGSNGVYDETGENMTSGSHSGKPQYQRLRFKKWYSSYKYAFGKIMQPFGGIWHDDVRKAFRDKGSDGYVAPKKEEVTEEALKLASKDNIEATKGDLDKYGNKLSFASKLKKVNQQIKQSVLTSDDDDEDTIGGAVERI